MRFLAVIYLLLALTACIQRNDSNTEKVKQAAIASISPSDFLNNYKIKFEVYKSDSLESQTWFTDGIDNFEGRWKSKSETFGSLFLTYKFHFLDDSYLKLELETFKDEKDSTPTGGITISFRLDKPLTLPWQMLERGAQNKEKQGMGLTVTPMKKTN